MRIALDDFGAGASSFGYLKTLPVDYLKIDGQFVRNLIENGLDAAAVRCFGEVARSGGHQDRRRVRRDARRCCDELREIGVDYAQGYLLHRPEPIARLLQGLRVRTV